MGLDFSEDSRAFSLVDFDRDGDLDLILKSRNAPQLRLLRNDTRTENHSIAFRLRGRANNREAIGALIELDTPRGRRLKQVQLGTGFLSQSSLAVYFGLGNATGPLQATITWPDGAQQILDSLPVDHLVSVVEGEPQPETTPFRARNFDMTDCPAQEPLKPGVRPNGYAFGDGIRPPAFSLLDLSDNTVTSASLRGRPALLNFWATWCAPCQEEMRQWTKYYADIKKAGAELVAISVNEPENRSQVERFARERQLPFPVLLIDRETLGRYDIFHRGLFTRSTGLQIPTSFLLNARGELVMLYRGIAPIESLQAALQTLKQAPEKLAQSDLPYPGLRFAGHFVRDYSALAADFVTHGLLADAALYFEEAVQQKPSDAKSWDALGKIYGELGQLENATRAFQQSIELHPDYAPAHVGLGRVHMLQGEPDLAEKALLRAVEVAPDDPEILRLCGRIFLNNGQLENAERIFAAYLELQPTDPSVHNALGAIHARAGRLRQAQESFLKATELKPDYEEAFKNLGTAYLQLRMPAQAVDVLERAHELAPEDNDASFALALGYARTHRLADAEQLLKKILESNPTHGGAQQALERLQTVRQGNPP